ncbi:MAG: helix-turn-helix domain-containing protein [Nitrososphaeraceae archaeon]|nr:helix-turn-helix domain-containing protein [Nitrososphaeraceae archaeon]
MRYTPVRRISEEEKRELYDLLDSNNSDIKYRAKIVLLAGEEGYTVPEIREMTNIYDKTIRKWIHRFNDHGICGLFTEIDYSRMIKITDEVKHEILHIALTNPRKIGLKFSTWSLRSIAGYVKEKKVVKEDGISHTAIRDILIEKGVEWRHSKTVLGSKSKDPEYDLKKAH